MSKARLDDLMLYSETKVNELLSANKAMQELIAQLQTRLESEEAHYTRLVEQYREASSRSHADR